MTQDNEENKSKSLIEKLRDEHLKHRQDFNLDKWNEEHLKHWRSWGSWFSWGSPIGLGIWFICCAVALYIVMQAIH